MQMQLSHDTLYVVYRRLNDLAKRPDVFIATNKNCFGRGKFDRRSRA